MHTHVHLCIGTKKWLEGHDPRWQWVRSFLSLYHCAKFLKVLLFTPYLGSESWWDSDVLIAHHHIPPPPRLTPTREQLSDLRFISLLYHCLLFFYLARSQASIPYPVSSDLQTPRGWSEPLPEPSRLPFPLTCPSLDLHSSVPSLHEPAHVFPALLNALGVGVSSLSMEDFPSQ